MEKIKRSLHNRTAAGQQLATQLPAYVNQDDVLVLGLPRGGVPVAYEVAKALQVPFDICLVRKLGLPGNKEFAMGAIAADGVRVLNNQLLAQISLPNWLIEQVSDKESQELQRRNLAYRGNRPLPNISNQTIILVDDGIATGATMRAAILWLKAHQAKKIVVAVPVAPAPVFKAIAATVYSCVCLMTPSPFYSVGYWYDHFTQVSDDEVIKTMMSVVTQTVTET